MHTFARFTSCRPLHIGTTTDAEHREIGRWLGDGCCHADDAQWQNVVNAISDSSYCEPTVVVVVVSGSRSGLSENTEHVNMCACVCLCLCPPYLPLNVECFKLNCAKHVTMRAMGAAKLITDAAAVAVSSAGWLASCQ